MGGGLVYQKKIISGYKGYAGEIGMSVLMQMEKNAGVEILVVRRLIFLELE